MNAKKEQICRLCLKARRCGFRGIDETMTQLFNILLLKLDLNITRDPIICQDCIEAAKKYLNFKLTCMYTEEIILSIPVGKKKSEYNIKFLFAKKEHIKIVNEEDLDICRFCLTRLKRNNFITLDTFNTDTMFEMQKKYMPEMDFNITDNPIICTTCRDSLEDYFQFLLNCLDIEDKINTYCQAERSGNIGLINLDDVRLFLFTNILEYPVNQQINKIKEESNRHEDTEFLYPEAYSELVKQEELDIKEGIELDKGYHKNPPEIISQSYMVPLNIRELNIDGYTYRQEIQGIIMEDDDIETNEHVVHTDKIKQTKHIESNFLHPNDSSKIDRCKYAERVSDPEHKNNVISNDVTVKNFQGIVSLHGGISETEIYKGSLCVYGGKQKRNIKTQMSVHKDVSKIGMYKCTLCTFETKRKYYLEAHVLCHKNISEIKSYKCPLCAYETKNKSDSKKHMLVHKDASDIKMFNCCTRMLAHKGAPEIKKFKCSSCTYEAKHKSLVIRHMLVHKDISETETFKCSLCTYETKRKDYLKSHVLVHKEISEIKSYKCALCTYQTKYKYDIKKHMVVHNQVSERKIFKCASCNYETKRKYNLKVHMLVHKNSSETEMYKCSLCAFETKHKWNVKKHMFKKHVLK